MQATKRRKCKVTDVCMSINGNRYKLAPSRDELGVFNITELDDDITYRVVPSSKECDCPDHLSTGVTCKHLLAVLRLGVVLACVIGNKPVPPQDD